MFGFGKKKKHEKIQKKKSKIDKLIMGAIVGGAVGSVIGMSIAPQKGKETREMIAQKGKELIKKGQDSFEKLTDAAEKKSQHEEEIISEARKNKKGVFSRLKEKVLGPGKKVKKGIMEDDDMRKIPNEVE